MSEPVRHDLAAEPPLRRFMWAVAWVFLWCMHRFFHRLRWWGRENMPQTGPVLLISNHQSYFDPPLIGVASGFRPFRQMARATLFRNPLFAWLIRLMGSIPVDRGAADMASMRACIEVLNRGNGLLLFPEGTRTLDGKTGRFANGIMVLIRRAKPKILPVAIEGAFDVWPRGKPRPRLFGRIGVMLGEPIDAQTLLDMKPDEALAHLQNTIETMRLEIASRLAK